MISRWDKSLIGDGVDERINFFFKIRIPLGLSTTRVMNSITQ